MNLILSFVGKSDSGKTTLLEKVIADLKQRGHRVAVIKHTQEFELDRRGTSSWQLAHAGSDATMISSPEKLALIHRVEKDFTPRQLARFFNTGYDIILTEGFKTANNMKVEVHRREQGSELLTPPEQLLAVVTDEPLDVKVPQFSRDEEKKLVDHIERWLQKQPREDEIELFINGEFVPMNQFVKSVFFRTVSGMVSSLKGVDEVTELRLLLRRKT